MATRYLRILQRLRGASDLPIGQNPLVWPVQLREYLARSSPERFRLAEDAGTLGPVIDQAIEYGLQELAMVSLNGGKYRVPSILAAVLERASGALEEAASIPLSRNLRNWPSDIRAQLARSSPESYQVVESADALDAIVDDAIEYGMQELAVLGLEGQGSFQVIMTKVMERASNAMLRVVERIGDGKLSAARLSRNPTGWESDLHNYLFQLSPDAYRRAQAAGALGAAIDEAIDYGLRELGALKRSNDLAGSHAVRSAVLERALNALMRVVDDTGPPKRTRVKLSSVQYVSTVAGNLTLKIKYHIGYHVAHYGRRSIDFYLQLASEVQSMYLAKSQPFSLMPSFIEDDITQIKLCQDALLAMGEVFTEVRANLTTNPDVYLKDAADFWRDSQRLLQYRLTSTGVPSQEIVDFILDSSESEYISRIDPQSLSIDKARFDLPAKDRYFKESGTKLAYEVLRDNPDIKSLLNIGGRIDPTLYFLAREFPDRKFLSFDFQHNLKEQNRTAFGQLPDNLYFGSGYALEALSEGLTADAVFFMATSVVFTIKEMQSYFRLLKQNGFKNIIISEGWASPLDGYDGGAIVRPEEIPIDKPFIGGTILNAHHNYLAHIQDAGFRIDQSEIIDDHFGGWYNIIQIVGSRVG